eukprot:1161480-Pelagomonas_calceolata.AAC.8
MCLMLLLLGAHERGSGGGKRCSCRKKEAVAYDVGDPFLELCASLVVCCSLNPRSDEQYMLGVRSLGGAPWRAEIQERGTPDECAAHGILTGHTFKDEMKSMYVGRRNFRSRSAVLGAGRPDLVVLESACGFEPTRRRGDAAGLPHVPAEARRCVVWVWVWVRARALVHVSALLPSCTMWPCALHFVLLS